MNATAADREGMKPRDALASLLTPVGRGAIAVVAIHGSAAFATVAECFQPRGKLPFGATTSGIDAGQVSVRFGRWRGPLGRDGGGMPPEDVLVLGDPAGVVEVHCHGGVAACERILRDLEAAGCRRADWREWFRIVGGGGIESEARLALAMARGPKASAILSHQLAGALARRLSEIKKLLAGERGDRDSARRQLERLRHWGSLGVRLTEPFRVIVCGPPNVGKSSLVNAVAGYPRSMVDARPGTTRDLVSTRLTIGGWDCEVTDTAGLRSDPDDAVEKAGIEAARTLAGTVDLVLEVRDATARGPEPRDSPHPWEPGDPRVLEVFSKCDLLAGDGQRFARSQLGRFVGESDDLAIPPWRRGPIATSAVTGHGIDLLAESIRLSLVPEEPLPGEAVPFMQRHLQEIDDLLEEAGLHGGTTT